MKEEEYKGKMLKHEKLRKSISKQINWSYIVQTQPCCGMVAHEVSISSYMPAGGSGPIFICSDTKTASFVHNGHVQFMATMLKMHRTTDSYFLAAAVTSIVSKL
jgi:hypothetical protein